MKHLDALIALLRPLGVYDLSEGSFSGAQLVALGEALDAARSRLAQNLRESIPATALDRGLEAYEELLPQRPAADTPEERRQALFALLTMGGSSGHDINAALAGCGIQAVASALPDGTLAVRFPGRMGVPEQFARRSAMIEEILPCHLPAVYVFRYVQWQDFAQLHLCWQELAGRSWAALPEYDIYAAGAPVV